MGETYRFTCPSCGYRAKVSGGEDCGFCVITQTVTCPECQALFDIESGEFSLGAEAKTVKHALRCHRSPTHTVQPWNHPGSCPKCGVTLTRGECIMSWD
jgi:Zn finger protein HypA/HybF involved in hydrogenase expression